MAQQTQVDRYARFEKALVRDRERKRETRAALNEAGEVYGGKLDLILIDTVALLLKGRPEGDPVRDAYMSTLGDVLRLHAVPLSPGFRRRLRARISVNSNLRWKLAERDLSDRVHHPDA